MLATDPGDILGDTGQGIGPLVTGMPQCASAQRPLTVHPLCHNRVIAWSACCADSEPLGFPADSAVGADWLSTHVRRCLGPDPVREPTGGPLGWHEAPRHRPLPYRPSSRTLITPRGWFGLYVDGKQTMPIRSTASLIWSHRCTTGLYWGVSGSGVPGVPGVSGDPRWSLPSAVLLPGRAGGSRL